MNEVKNRKERTERKRSLGDVNRLTMAMPPSPPLAEPPVKRPSRACSSRRLSEVAASCPRVPSPTPPVPRASNKVSNAKTSVLELPPPRPSASRTGVRAVSLVLSPSLSTAQKDRLELRSMWELAAIINFFNVFRPILNLGSEFTMDELESAFLTPNRTLDTIHVTLLKAIPPAARVPLTGDTWPIVLSKKFKDWWWRVAGGPCPLIPSQGAELAAYREFDPPTRVRILLALCEMRVDQEDARLYIDESVKHGYTLSAMRKDRSGCGAEGTTFWLEDDPIMGQRLYREGQATVKSKAKGWGKGRNVPPPIPGNWETVATNFEEFQEVSQRLLDSRNRMEAAMGKKIIQNIMPQLEEIEKKKERMIKKQQRAAVLLDSLIQGNGLAAGRSRRERKPVTYTFDEFDRSISEAIKFTKKNVPETSLRRDLRFVNGASVGPGHVELGHVGKERNGNAAYGQVGYVNGGGGARRSLRSSQPHLGPEVEGEAEGVGAEPHYVEADIGFSDDDIEGEAVYDDDYIAARQRRDSYSLEIGDGFRGDDQDDADFDGVGERNPEDSDGYGEFDRGGSDGGGSEGRGRKRQRRGPKVRLVNDISREGERRNKRPVPHEAGNSDDDESDFGEQIERDASLRSRKVGGARMERSARGLGGNVTEGVEEEFEEASDSDGASGYGSERENGKEAESFEEERENGHVSQIEDDDQSADHSEEHSVQHSGRSGSADEQEEAGSVDFDEDDNMGHEVESNKGSGKRRQLLDLNEVATGARGHSPLSDNEESEYSGDEREDDDGAEAG